MASTSDQAERQKDTEDDDSKSEHDKLLEEFEDVQQILLDALANAEAGSEKSDKYETAEEGDGERTKLLSNAKYEDEETSIRSSVQSSIQSKDTQKNVELTELKLIVPTPPQTQHYNQGPGFVHTPAIKLDKQRQRRKLLEKQQSQVWKVVCGLVTIVLMLGIAAVLIFLAFMYDIDDLYIVGGIFTLGGSMFAVGFIVVRCMVIFEIRHEDQKALFNITPD